jgi:site-specific recombinase XerD
MAVVEAKAELGREYLQRHSGAIHAGWKGFEPYCLRHSALTMLAESGCDAFTLARIAGHSSITITQRYCHPQADAIERAFKQVQSTMQPAASPTLDATKAKIHQSSE